MHHETAEAACRDRNHACRFRCASTMARLSREPKQSASQCFCAKVVRHSRSIIFQMAAVAVPRMLFAEILRLIEELGPRRAPS